MSIPGALMSDMQKRSIAQADARINIWEGAIRSGKTFSSLWCWLRYLAHAPTSGELVIVGRTRETIERNVIAPLRDAAVFGKIARVTHHVQGSNTAKIMGRTVWLIGANDVQAETKIRGLTCCGAYVDEIALLPKVFFTQILGRMSVPGAKLFGTTNPGAPNHWLRTDFLLRIGELDMKTWHFVLNRDNPSLTREYIDSVSAEFTGLWYRRFILGEWVAAEGSVYDMWDPDRHVITADQLPPIERWLSVGVDYGTTNPFAAILHGIGDDHRIYAVAEYRYDSRQQRRSLTDVEYSRRLREWMMGIPIPHTTFQGVTPEVIVVDPSAASFKIQLYRDGITTTNGDNDVMNGIRTVSSLLTADRYRVVGSACPGLVSEFPGYAWDERKAENGEDAVIKTNDHSLDGARYGLHTTRHRWRNIVMPGQRALEAA